MDRERECGYQYGGEHLDDDDDDDDKKGAKTTTTGNSGRVGS